MIKIREVSKNFRKVCALVNISMDIDLTGTIYGIVGPNGSGKTTLISIISGFTQVSSGKIEISGPTIIGSYVGNESFIEHLTVQEWIEFIHDLKDLPVSYSEIEELLELMKLNDEKSKKISKLSFGLKQRLGIVSVLCGNPKLVIFDEPLNGLDPSGVFLFKNVLNWLKNKKVSVLYSSHRLDDLANYCDHLFILKKGSLIFDDSFNKFLEIGDSDIENSYNLLLG